MAETVSSTWYERLIAAHTSITNSVSHGERLKSDRYFVWEEDGANDLTADDRHADRAVTGRTDLYTKTEFDPWAEELEAAFNDAEIFWSRVSSEYEPDTRFWHVSWDWEVLI